MRLWRATVELCRLLLLDCDNTSFVHQSSTYFTRSVISQGSPPGKVVSGLCGLHRYWLLRGWRSRERAIIRNFTLYLNEACRCPGGWGKEDLKLSRWAGKYLSSICCWLWCFQLSISGKRLDAACYLRYRSALSNTLATAHMWLLTTWNVASPNWGMLSV